VAAWIWAVIVAYTRMALGVHYPSDELGSIAISVCLAFILNKFLIGLDFLKENKISAAGLPADE